MGPDHDVTVRASTERDIAAICAFGAAHIPTHYEPLIGWEAARVQVTNWWTSARIERAVRAGQVAVAEAQGDLVGVAERGRWQGEHVVWKLYVHPQHQRRGIGPRLLEALIGQLPPEADRLLVEHFAANERAAAFYEREGFVHLRTEPGPEDNPDMAVVWRSLDLTNRRAESARPGRR